jgi:hypothetical protein
MEAANAVHAAASKELAGKSDASTGLETHEAKTANDDTNTNVLETIIVSLLLSLIVRSGTVTDRRALGLFSRVVLAGCSAKGEASKQLCDVNEGRGVGSPRSKLGWVGPQV